MGFIKCIFESPARYNINITCMASTTKSYLEYIHMVDSISNNFYISKMNFISRVWKEAFFTLN